MAASGTIEIGGKQYTWTSPTLKQLMEFEQTTGLLFQDPKSYSSVRGRAYLAEICLREKHPDITAGEILTWPAETYVPIWEMISKAIPVFTVVEVSQGPPEKKPGDEAGQGTGRTSTSPRVPTRSAGHLPAQDGSE